MYLKNLDCDGKEISVGDHVIFMRATEHLLRDLPLEDQHEINAQVGKVLTVSQFDDYGYAELEFESVREGDIIIYHTIWIEPIYLKKCKP